MQRHAIAVGAALPFMATVAAGRARASAAFLAPLRWNAITVTTVPPCVAAVRLPLRRPVAVPHPRLFSSASAASHPSPPTVTVAPSSLQPPLVVRGGVASRSLTWTELFSAVSSRNWRQLGRLQTVHEAYGEHRTKVLQEHTSLGDFIRAKHFAKVIVASSAPSAGSSATTTSASAAPSASALRLSLAWSPNTFPYACAPGVHHDLLWCAGGELDDASLRDEVERRLPNDRFETCYFVNPVGNRSIKDLYHAHVFWRRRSSSPHSSSEPLPPPPYEMAPQAG